MNSIVQIFVTTPGLFLFAVGVVGLSVGSFLNVVIHRVPIMLDRTWRSECRAYLELEPEEASPDPYNVIVPGSSCPQCGKPIRFWENIPVISYVFLRGQCSGCGAGISLRYPAVEVLTALVSMACAWRFGVTIQTAMALVLSWTLVGLSFIDIARQLLPDVMTLPVLWLGLILSLFEVFTDPTSSILGAGFGYISLWSVYHLFRLATGREGMGHGDFKLLALLGAWLGWTVLPAIVLLSSLVGAAVGLIMITVQGHDRRTPIPFGPYLAVAGWIALLWGHRINAAYLHFAGFPG